jgi:hypothetical protein
MSKRLGIAHDAEVVDYVIEEYYRKTERPFAAASLETDHPGRSTSAAISTNRPALRGKASISRPAFTSQ